MMDRREIISYSCRYGGEYRQVLKAIEKHEPVELVDVQNALTIFDEEYPKEFLQLQYPPFVLFFKGDLSLLKKEKISVVGSRDACEYALKATEGLCRKNEGKVIVSGMARGIDAASHRYARYTIGVLGCGIDCIYPRENRELYEKVMKEGLLLSEYPGTVRPYGYHFPFRNRLISALSNTVYIMQSSTRSGTMTTVREALELGKNVKVLPYDVFHKDGLSNNLLIKEGADIIEREEIAF